VMMMMMMMHSAVHCFEVPNWFLEHTRNYVQEMIWYICKLQLVLHRVAVVPNTYIHQQYTEQHSKTEYTEQNITTIRIRKHNSKNTQFTKWNRSIQNIEPYIQRWKWNKKNVKESDRRKSHISSKLHMICISSNNVRHPVTKTFSTFHYISPN
jgi:hypothetical protein